MLGGWNVHRHSTDKSANALNTAESIMKTIMDPVEEEDLKFLLEDLSDATFGEKASALEDSELGKRPRRAGEEKPASSDFDEDGGDECF